MLASTPDHSGTRRRLAVAGATVVAALTLSIGTARLAPATFVTGATASGTLSTDTLVPPSNLSAGLCLLGSVTLTWTTSPSSWADGYEIRWGTSSSGPYNTGSAITALTTQTITGLSLLTTYHFVVRAYDGNWRSVDAGPRSVTC